MLYVPPGARQARRCEMPEGDIRLMDGRLLKEVYILPAGRTWQTQSGLRVIASLDNTEVHGVLLHVSLSRNDRLPDWHEIRCIKEAFFGDDIDAMMVLPKKIDYVNQHQYCFHLWETPVTWGIG